jgi:hypothetical protein
MTLCCYFSARIKVNTHHSPYAILSTLKHTHTEKWPMHVMLYSCICSNPNRYLNFNIYIFETLARSLPTYTC